MVRSGVRSGARRLPGRRRAGWCGLLLGLLLGSGCTPPDTRTPTGRPDGAKIYKVYCVGCHGPDGRRGDPRSHLADDAAAPADELRAAIERGGDGMPAWKGKLSPEEIEAVIAHIRALGGRPSPAAATR